MTIYYWGLILPCSSLLTAVIGMANLSNISNDCAHAQYSIPSTQSNVVPLQAASNVTSEDHTIYGTGISTIQVAQDRVILSSGDGICFGKLDSPPKILIIYTERNVQSKNWNLGKLG